MTHESQLFELTDGRKIGFVEYGIPDGIPIFYFHGFPGSRLEAGHFHEVAVSREYRLIGVDRPGMGLSSMDKNRTILSWTTDIANLADFLEIEKFSIIGHSGGAIVSGMAPTQNPASRIGMARGQRIANKLIKTMPWLSGVMMRLTAWMLKKPKMMKQMIEQLPEVDQAFFRDPEVGRMIINSTMEAFRHGVAGPAKEMNLIVNAWGFNLENIKYPITIWHGTLDSQVPVSHARIYANLSPGAKLKLIENEGHHSLIRNYMDKILMTTTESISLSKPPISSFRQL